MLIHIIGNSYRVGTDDSPLPAIFIFMDFRTENFPVGLRELWLVFA